MNVQADLRLDLEAAAKEEHGGNTAVVPFKLEESEFRRGLAGQGD